MIKNWFATMNMTFRQTIDELSFLIQVFNFNQNNASSKSRNLRSSHCSLRNKTIRSIKFQTTIQNSNYDNYYFVWMFEIETIEIATKLNQTSLIEQNTRNFQNLRKSEFEKKWKQKNLKSCFEIASDANKCNVSSCFVVMLRKKERT